MKSVVAAFVITAMSSLAAFAAEPAKTMDTKDGKIFTTEKGMTLYTFDKDAMGKSNCDAKCLKNWPAYHAASGAKAEGEWTLVKSSDGKEMWAYEGKPVYTYVKDMKSGDINGDGVGGVWHVAK